MLLYALISDDVQAVVDFYPTRAEAEADLLDCLSDVPEWWDVLRVQAFEIETSANRNARASVCASRT
jgi:hypothetical protein